MKKAPYFYVPPSISLSLERKLKLERVLSNFKVCSNLRESNQIWESYLKIEHGQDRVLSRKSMNFLSNLRKYEIVGSRVRKNIKI